MENDNLLSIIEYANNLKSAIVMIDGNVIYGTDPSFTYLKSINFQNLYDSKIVLLYSVNDMKAFIKGTTMPDQLKIKNNRLESIDGNNISIFNHDWYMRFANMILMKNNIDSPMNNRTILYQNENIRDDSNFENLLKYKSGDGIGIYKINNRFALSIFNSLLPINKDDTVGLTIYDMDCYKFLARFSIYKKKIKNTINIYIMYLYI